MELGTVRITFDPYEIEKEEKSKGEYEIRWEGRWKTIESYIIVFSTGDTVLETLDKIKEIVKENNGVEKIEYVI